MIEGTEERVEWRREGDCRLLAASAAREQTPGGFSSPFGQQRQKNTTGSSRGAVTSKSNGGERGIRTPDTVLPVYRFSKPVSHMGYKVVFEGVTISLPLFVAFVVIMWHLVCMKNEPTIAKFRSENKPHLRYRVRWVEGGRERNRFFRTHDQARGFFNLRKQEFDRIGAQAGKMTDEQRIDSLKAYEHLEQRGIPLESSVALLCKLYDAVQKLGGTTTLDDCVNDMVKRLEHRANQSNVEIGQAIDAFIAEKQSGGLRPKTVTSLEIELNACFRGRLEQPLSSFTREDASAWIRSKDISARTQANRRQRLSVFFEWCIDKKHMTENYASRVKTAKIPKPNPKALTVAQSRRLIDSAAAYEGGRFLAYQTLTLFAGVRPHEASRLTWNAVDLQNSLCRIEGDESKTTTPRVIDLPDNCVAWLEKASLLGFPIFPEGMLEDSIKPHMRMIRQLAGITPWVQDYPRHTAISARLASGIGLERTALWAGNSASVVNRHYKALMTPQQAEAFWSIRPEENTVVQFESEATA